MNINEAVGERVLELRTEAGLSQMQLAEKAGIRQNQLSRLETNRQQWSVAMLVRVSAALGVTPSVVLSETEAPPVGLAAAVDALRAQTEALARQIESGWFGATPVDTWKTGRPWVSDRAKNVAVTTGPEEVATGVFALPEWMGPR